MTHSCPSLETLRSYSRRLLDQEGSTKIATHVGDCPYCSTALSRIDADQETTQDYRGGRIGELLGTETDEATPDATTSTAGKTPELRLGRLETTQTVGWDEKHKSSGPAPDSATRWFGRYRVIRLLGSGAFGNVYLGHDPELVRDVAIKVPQKDRIRSVSDVELYLDEARVLASLDHPHILPVYDAGRTGDEACFLVAKFVEGTDLKSLMTSRRFDPAESARLIKRLAEGLSHAHSMRVVHRDVKPANILIGADGHPYLADFGLALNLDSPVQARAGTPEFMSPEQARGEAHRVDGRSDLYSLGVVFYRLLTGHRPFQVDSVQRLLELIATAEVPPPSRHDPGLPPELERICLKMLAKRVADRYQSAGELAEDLRAWRETPTPETSTTDVALAPKGLRSFDGHDSRVFLDLLPGPRDRDGLPESVASWKRRIEADGSEGFAVGLLLGPSGSGKSSLVKAGLIPRLDPRCVVVDIEASSEGTEARLIDAFGSAFPRLRREESLRETLAAVRRGTELAVGTKVVLVLDQFEQWLASARVLDGPGGLAEALHQCDGRRLVALLVVRDDFALEASRFLDAVEVPLVQGKNFATVDRFDKRHARSVLTAFGKALGKLPAGEPDLSRSRAEFLDRAVGLLEEKGKVNPARLSLFVQWVADREWSPSALRDLGGAEGLGLAFLESAFNSDSTPPILASQAREAKAILEALLPPPGIVLKGAMRSKRDLIAGVPGLGQEDAEALFRALDSDLRLITPVVGIDRHEVHYQLTHDYLVPSIRRWLNKDRLSTLGGRLGVRLAEAAGEWDARPSPKRLPGWWEYPLLEALTDRKARSAPERRMLSAARRHYGFRAGVGLVGVGIISAVAVAWLDRTERRRNLERAGASVQQLLRASPAMLDEALADLRRFQGLANPQLAAILDDPSRPVSDRRRSRYGLLADRPSEAPNLAVGLLDDDLGLDEMMVLLDGVATVPKIAVEPLWAALLDEHTAARRRMRAALALARLDAGGRADDRESWPRAARFVADELLRELAESPSDYTLLVDGVRPIRGPLTLPLMEASTGRDATASETATNVLVDLDADRPDVLVPLAIEGKPARMVRLLPLLGRWKEASLKELRAALQRPLPLPTWQESPIPSEWEAAPADATREVEASGGMIAGRFAFCQSLPLDRVIPLTESLRKARYRPIRLRPYRDGDRIAVAIAWTRDPRGWSVDLDLAEPALLEANRTANAAGLEPIDLAGYLPASPSTNASPTIRFACLRAKFEPGQPPAVAEVFPSDEAFRRWKEALDRQPAGFYVALQSTHRIIDLPKGERLHTVVTVRVPWVGGTQIETRLFDGIAAEYRGDRYPGRLQTEVDVGRASLKKSQRDATQAELAELDRQLGGAPENPSLVFDRALVLYRLDRYEECRTVLDGLIVKYPPYAWQFKFLRSLTLLKLGDRDQSKADFDEFRARNDDPSRLMLLEVSIATTDRKLDEGRRIIEAWVAGRDQDVEVLKSAASATTLLADKAHELNDPKAGELADLAIGLLARAIKKGVTPTKELLDDFEELRDHPKMIALVGKMRLDDRYDALWQAVEGMESTEVHGLAPAEHLARCKDLAAQGYRIAAISGFRPDDDRNPVLASVWHRPILAEEDRERDARRRAMAALALVRLDEPDAAWERLRAVPDPRLATAIVHGMAPAGISPSLILARLDQEPRADGRRALLLALGDYSPDGEIRALIPEVVRRAIKLYQADPDPGVHSAAEWLARTLGADEERRQVGASLQGRDPAAERNWYVNRQGQEFSIARGPVEFLMGAAANSGNQFALGESDQHRRRINRSFAIGMKEVTNAEFDRFLRENPGLEHHPEPDYSRNPDAPAFSVSWRNAALYCRWLSTLEGIAEDQQPYQLHATSKDDQVGINLAVGYLLRTGYRLPTEAEWEYAVRSGTNTRRPHGWSDDWLGLYENVTDLKSHLTAGTREVGSLRPHPLGLFDALSNISEWSTTRTNYFDPRNTAEFEAGIGGVFNDYEYPGIIAVDDAFIARGAVVSDRLAQVRTSWRLPNRANFKSSNNARLGLRVCRTVP